MVLTDLQLERAIEEQGRKIQEAFERGDKKQARICFDLMAGLIGQRNERQVARMEAKIFNAGTFRPEGSDCPFQSDTPAPKTQREEGKGHGR